jgi:hypothetical protein
MVSLLCKWLVYFEKLLFTLFKLSALVNENLPWLPEALRIGCHPKMADIRHREKG